MKRKRGAGSSDDVLQLHAISIDILSYDKIAVLVRLVTSHTSDAAGHIRRELRRNCFHQLQCEYVFHDVFLK